MWVNIFKIFVVEQAFMFIQRKLRNSKEKDWYIWLNKILTCDWERNNENKEYNKFANIMTIYMIDVSKFNYQSIGEW